MSTTKRAAKHTAPDAPEQAHHYFATTAVAWAVALTRREAIANVLRDSKGVFKSDSNGGIYVWSARVGVPKDSSYALENYMPVDVPLESAVHGSFKLLPKGRVVHLTPIED